MKLSRKLQKFLSTDFFASAFEHLSRGPHPVNKQRIWETLDRAQFDKLREQYPYRPGSPRINRFEDVVYWIEITIERAQDLWLDRAPPMRIVDLGCGAGYFLYVCNISATTFSASIPTTRRFSAPPLRSSMLRASSAESNGKLPCPISGRNSIS